MVAWNFKKVASRRHRAHNNGNQATNNFHRQHTKMRLISKIKQPFACNFPVKLEALSNAGVGAVTKTYSALGSRTVPFFSLLPAASGPILFLALQASSLSTAVRIIQQQSVGKLSFIPFVSLTLNCLVWSLYGCLRRDFTVLLPNASGFLVGLFCMWAYQSNTRSTPWSLYAILAGSIAAVCGLANLGAVQAVGLIGCALSVGLSGSPLAVISTVLRDKSTESLPFSTSFLTWLNNLSWLCYGIFSAKDPVIYGPNILGFALATAQMLLFLKYGFRSRKNETQRGMF